MSEYRVDPSRDISRASMPETLSTGIYVRALREGRWDNADIFELDIESLREWVRSRGAVSEWAMGLIEHLLLHPRDERCGAVNPRTGWVCWDRPHESKTHHTLMNDEVYDWQMEV